MQLYNYLRQKLFKNKISFLEVVIKKNIVS